MASLLTFVAIATALAAGTVQAAAHTLLFHHQVRATRGLSDSEEFPCDPPGLRTTVCSPLRNGSFEHDSAIQLERSHIHCARARQEPILNILNVAASCT